MVDRKTILNFARNGTCKIVRRGDVVTISTIVNVTIGEGCSASNKITLPTWAYPAKDLLTDGMLRSNISTDMNGYARTQIVINVEYGYIALFTYNTDDVNTPTVHNIITYLVD